MLLLAARIWHFAEHSECQKGRHYTGNSVAQTVTYLVANRNIFVSNHVLTDYKTTYLI